MPSGIQRCSHDLPFTKDRVQITCVHKTCVQKTIAAGRAHPEQGNTRESTDKGGDLPSPSVTDSPVLPSGERVMPELAKIWFCIIEGGDQKLNLARFQKTRVIA